MATCMFAAVLAGCFTFHQTEKPETPEATRAPAGRDIKVSVSGFAASLTEFMPVHGPESPVVPIVRPNDAFLQRAQSQLEENGFLLRAAPADYTVDVTFSGPFVSASENSVQLAWMFLSVLSAEYEVQTWKAKIKIYDNKTGRILFHKDDAQRYEIVVWSPLFFVGLSGCTESTWNYMQNWCLTALTDRAVSAASAFLAGQVPQQQAPSAASAN